jgi:IS30 family transposase
MAWSPEQISARLEVDFPDDESMRISHEAIYQALYVQGRGALRRELTACLRSGRALRVPRARVRGRDKSFVTEQIMISERPAEAEDRAIPGHWEGDLILGADRTAIGTLVERSTRFTMLLHLPPMPGHGGPRANMGRRSPVAEPKPCAMRSQSRSRRCPSSYAARSPGTKAPRCHNTRS